MRRGHQICSLATAGHRGAEKLSDAVSQVAPAVRREDVVSRFDGKPSRSVGDCGSGAIKHPVADETPDA